ncbi:hypothetical protein D1872_81120 [compost metagenome]
MAESKFLDIAQTVMIERYGLDEQVYCLESFTEGTKAVSIKMSDGFIPISVKFPLEFLEFERVRRMNLDERRGYFVHIAPNFSKLSYEARELFADIVENWDDPEAFPELKERPEEDSIDAEEEEKPKAPKKPVKKPVRKVGKPAKVK